MAYITLMNTWALNRRAGSKGDVSTNCLECRAAMPVVLCMPIRSRTASSIITLSGLGRSFSFPCISSFLAVVGHRLLYIRHLERRRATRGGLIVRQVLTVRMGDSREPSACLSRGTVLPVLDLAVAPRETVRSKPLSIDECRELRDWLNR